MIATMAGSLSTLPVATNFNTEQSNFGTQRNLTLEEFLCYALRPGPIATTPFIPGRVKFLGPERRSSAPMHLLRCC